MSFLSCLFDKTKRHLIDIFSFCQKDNLKKISFCYLLDIFLLCRKDNLKKTTFSYFLVFCAVWVVLHNKKFIVAPWTIPVKLAWHSTC